MEGQSSGSEGRHDDAGVAALAQRLGLPGIADVHVHFMPEPVLRKVWAFFDRVSVSAYGTDWPIAYRFDEYERLARLRAMSVLRFSSLVYAHKPGMAEWLSGWALDFAERTPGCCPTATFYPEPGVEKYVEQALQRGARLFKVHVQVGDFDPRDELLRPVWGMLADARVPIVVHCGSGPAPGRFTGAAVFRSVMQEHPRLRAVVAHLGLPEYAEFLAMADEFEDLVLDTTMVFTAFSERGTPFPAALRPQLLDLGLRSKVAFGSDYPNIPYSYGEAVDALVRLDLGEAWLRQVLWGAGRQVLGA